jgi:hypothetical protein
MLVGLKRRLLPGAPILFQLHNYDRIAVGDERTHPFEVAPVTVDDLVIVQRFEPRDDGVVLHTTEVRRLMSGSETDTELLETHQKLLQGWRRAEIEELCKVSRLQILETHGDMKCSPYDALESPELVIIARA